METLYDLLGALPNDDADELRAAFRRAVKRVHPDINSEDPDAGLKFHRIVRANEILGDAEQRAAYDHLLALEHQEQEQAAKQAAADKVRKVASGVMALAGISVVAVGAMRCSCNCRRTPLRLQPPPRKQYAYRQLSSLLDLPKMGRKAFQLRRRKHPGVPTSPPRRLCRHLRPRRVARDDRSATPRSTRRNSLLPTLIAASFFIAWANSRTPLLNLLRQSARALIERAVLSGRRREGLLNLASTGLSGCRLAAGMSARSHAR
jgi:hypothetical protein